VRKLKLNADFYQKTLHSHEYYTSPKKGDTAAVGANDNSWCSDPEAVVEVFSKTDKPWIAFKILAAGAIHPRTAFPYAVTQGADFILVGMFDWQVEDDAAGSSCFTLLGVLIHDGVVRGVPPDFISVGVAGSRGRVPGAHGVPASAWLCSGSADCQPANFLAAA
jgi:hypothetical protein